MEIQELFDYNILYFDKSEYKETEIRYVVEYSFDKKTCDTTYTYISELQDNIPIFSKIILPYARITKQRLLNYYLKDGVLCRNEEKINFTKRKDKHKSNYNRFFRGLNRGWR